MDLIEFKMTGPAFEDGMPLHLVTKGLDELQALLDKPFLHIEKKERLIKSDRHAFYVRAQSIRQACFLAELEIIYQSAQIALPVIAAVGPQTIWDYAKETWKFLELIYRKAKEGHKPMIQTNDNGTTTVIYGDANYTFNAPVLNIGKMSLPHYKALAALLKGSGVETVSLGVKDAPEIALDQEHKDLFRVPTRVDPEAFSLECEFFDFNKRKNGGKLSVAAGQAIPAGEYNFSIFGPQDQVEYVLSLLKPEITVQCLKEEHIDPLGENKIRQLHILGVGS